jgi:hypothetical protein
MATIVCDVGRVRADAGAVGSLARLELAARRSGCGLRLRNASRELCELVVFMGLEGVLSVEPGREAEEREQRLGLEEERQLADPAV